MGVPLVQVSDVATLMPGNLTSGDTDILTNYAAAVSDFARNYCDREFWIGTYTESYRGKNSVSILLKQRPVKSVAGLYVDNVSILPVPNDSNSSPIRVAYGFWNDDRAVYLGGGYRFRYSDYPNVTVTYTAGYASSGDYAALKAVASDLYEALCREVVNQFKGLSHVGLKSEGMQGQTTTYSTDAALDSTKGVLNNYKRTWLYS